MLTSETLPLVFPKGFSLRDVLTNDNLRESIAKQYIPDFKFSYKPGEGDAFFQPKSFSVIDGDVYDVYYLYFNKSGQLMNNDRISYVQIPGRLDVGYLMRIRFPSKTPTENLMEIDYFIALNNVDYEFKQEIRADKNTNEILSSEVLVFRTISLTSYGESLFMKDKDLITSLSDIYRVLREVTQ